MHQNQIVTAVIAVFLINFANSIHGFRLTGSVLRGNAQRGDLRMDDEIPRPGIKEELTTREEYMESRFTCLSFSGHDLTPLTEAELNTLIARQADDEICENLNENAYLGMGCKGLYVCIIGGLPLFASGSRVDAASCNRSLFFSEPCDVSHVKIHGNQVYCVRSGHLLGETCRLHDDSLSYKIQAKSLRFLDIRHTWPPESQPENFWGSEGQYRSWNMNEMSDKPLSY
jgi:peptide methionine sulfoxide reductase MsrB